MVHIGNGNTEFEAPASLGSQSGFMKSNRISTFLGKIFVTNDDIELELQPCCIIALPVAAKAELVFPQSECLIFSDLQGFISRLLPDNGFFIHHKCWKYPPIKQPQQPQQLQGTAWNMNRSYRICLDFILKKSAYVMFLEEHYFSCNGICMYFHAWKFSRSVWTGLWEIWLSERYPCPWQGQWNEMIF